MSVLTTVLSLMFLAVLAGPIRMTPWVANVLATAAGTVPSYELNRRWVWGRQGANDPWREVVPFWTLSLSGLVLSSVAVAAAGRWASSVDLTGPPRTLVLLTANVGTFGALWVAQFVLLDRLIFRSRHRRLDGDPVPGGEVGPERVVDREPVLVRLGSP